MKESGPVNQGEGQSVLGQGRDCTVNVVSAPYVWRHVDDRTVQFTKRAPLTIYEV
jgi:hypothetical protein